MRKFYLTSSVFVQICGVDGLSTTFKSVPLSRCCPAICPAKKSLFSAGLDMIVPLSRLLLSLICVCVRACVCMCVYLRDSGTAGQTRLYYYFILIFQRDRYINLCPAICPAMPLFCPAVSVSLCLIGFAGFLIIKYGGFIDG